MFAQGRLVAGALASLMSVSLAFAAECPLRLTFSQANKPPKSATEPSVRVVRYDARSLVFTARMRVDADGGPHTYSSRDPDGTLCNPAKHRENVGKDPIQLGCAMDTLCVGMNIIGPDKTELSCTAALNKFAELRDARWKPQPGFRIKPVGIAMKSADEPCIGQNGYIVSTSSTPSGEGDAHETCDQSRYLDTLVSSIVVPKCWSNAYRTKHMKECNDVPGPGVEPGQFVAVRGRSSRTVHFAIVGDLGPNNKLGEASVGLLMVAARRTEAPTYVTATNRLDGLETFDVVVFKGTAYGKPLNLSHVGDMERASGAVFRQWAGSEQASTARLIACGH